MIDSEDFGDFDGVVAMLAEVTLDLTAEVAVKAWRSPDRKRAILVVWTPDYPGGYGILVSPQTLASLCRGAWNA